MKLRKIAAFITAAAVVYSTGISASAEWYDIKRDPDAAVVSSADETDTKKSSIEYDMGLSYYSFGNSVAINFKYNKKYKYKVHYGDGKKQHSINPQANGFAFLRGLKNDTTYTVKVVCSDGKNEYSETVKFKFKSLNSNVITVKHIKKNTVRLEWDDFAPNQTYIVSISKNGKWQKVAEVKKNKYTINKLKSGKGHTYMISVKGKNGEIIKTNCVVTVYSGCEQVSNVKADYKNKKLTWKPVSEADGYYVYKNIKGQYVKILNVKGKTNCKISSDKTEYAVAAYIRNSDGTVSIGEKGYSPSVKKETAQTAVVIAPPVETAAPKTPAILDAKRKDNSILLNWENIGNGASYGLYMLSSNGKYVKLIDTTLTYCTVTDAPPNKSYSFKIIAKKDGKYSEYSETYTMRSSEVRTIKSATSMMKGAGWDKGIVINVKSGDSARVLGTMGNFYLCTVGDKNGYIYKRAIDGGAAPSMSNVTTANLNDYLDDIIYTIGNSPKAIWTYVNKLKYSAGRIDTRITNVKTLKTYCDELAVNMLKYNSGMCYHYAALSGKLLQRAGYSVKLVYCPHKKNGFHCYNIVYYQGKWQYLDACRHSTQNEKGFLPSRLEFIKLRDLAAEKEEIADIK